MTGPESFLLTNRSGCLTVDGIDDIQDFAETLVSFYHVNFHFCRNHRANGLCAFTRNSKQCVLLDFHSWSRTRSFVCSPSSFGLEMSNSQKTARVMLRLQIAKVSWSAVSDMWPIVPSSPQQNPLQMHISSCISHRVHCIPHAGWSRAADQDVNCSCCWDSTRRQKRLDVWISPQPCPGNAWLYWLMAPAPKSKI